MLLQYCMSRIKYYDVGSNSIDYFVSPIVNPLVLGVLLRCIEICFIGRYGFCLVNLLYQIMNFNRNTFVRKTKISLIKTKNWILHLFFCLNITKDFSIISPGWLARSLLRLLSTLQSWIEAELQGVSFSEEGREGEVGIA